MKEKILEISDKLRNGELNIKEAQKQFLFLFSVNESYLNEKEIFCVFSKKIFKKKFQFKFDNTDSNNVIDEFENECKIKAKKLGMDISKLFMDGNYFHFDSDDEYNNEEKDFWWSYHNENICEYSWF